MSNIKLEIEKDITEDFKKLEEDYKKDMELFDCKNNFLEYQKDCINANKVFIDAFNLAEVEVLEKYLATSMHEFTKIPVLIGPTISNYNLENINEMKKIYIKFKYYGFEISNLVIDLCNVINDNDFNVVVTKESFKARLKALYKLLLILDEDIVKIIETIKKHKNEKRLINEYINYIENETKRITNRLHLIYECICQFIDKK